MTKPLSAAKRKELATRAELGPRLRRASETFRPAVDLPQHRPPQARLGKFHPTRDSGGSW